MRFGLALPHYDTSFAGAPASWDALKDVATTAERAGFDSLWVSDHLFLDWGKYGGADDPRGSFECWTTLSALGSVTESVRLGSLTLCNDLRNPGLLAQMVATLDRLTGGRVDVGLGAGWYEPEYRAAGIVFDPPGERIRRLGESAHVLRRLLTGEVVDHDGKSYKMSGAICRPLPVQEPAPPIWFGGKGDYLLRTAARHADGWNFSWLGDLDTYRGRSQMADKVCEEEDRDPASLRRSVGAYLVCGTDRSDLERRARRLADRTPAGVLAGRDAVAALQGVVKGTVDEVLEVLGNLPELGVEEVIFTLGVLPFQLGDLEDVEMVGENILPALR